MGLFWESKKYPLDVSVLGGLASESVEMPEPERTGTGGTRFGTGTVGTGTKSNYITGLIVFGINKVRFSGRTVANALHDARHC